MRQLQRMSYEEALTMVTMLGVGADGVRGLGTGAVGTINGNVALAGIVQALPPWQYKELNAVFAGVWATSIRAKPAEREVWDWSKPIGYAYTIVIDNRRKAWAYAIHRASQHQGDDNALMQEIKREEGHVSDST